MNEQSHAPRRPREREWAKHYQHVWRERTANTNLPNWLRVAFLAYGSHGANGHAQFGDQEIGAMLGSIDRATGEMRIAPRQRVHEAIKGAVAAGFLAEGSVARCLIVPGHAIEKTNGDVNQPCNRHPPRRPPGSERRAVTPEA